MPREKSLKLNNRWSDFHNLNTKLKDSVSEMHQSSGKMRPRKSYDLPMRVRRRQSDARWRANVASCFETLKHVIPVNKRAGKRQISKAFILQETSKHITFLEGTLATLFQEKCKLDGKPEEARERVHEVHSSFIERQREKMAALNSDKKFKRSRYKFYSPLDITPAKNSASGSSTSASSHRRVTPSPKLETRQLLKGKVEEPTNIWQLQPMIVEPVTRDHPSVKRSGLSSQLSRTAKGVDLNFPFFPHEEQRFNRMTSAKERTRSHSAPERAPRQHLPQRPPPHTPQPAPPLNHEGRARRAEPSLHSGCRRVGLLENGRHVSLPFGRIIVIAPRPQGISYKPHNMQVPHMNHRLGFGGVDEMTHGLSSSAPAFDALPICPPMPVITDQPRVKMEIVNDTYGGKAIHSCATPQKRKPCDESLGSPDNKRLNSPFYSPPPSARVGDVTCLKSPRTPLHTDPLTKFGSPMYSLSLPLSKSELFPDLLTPTKETDGSGNEYTPLREKCQEETTRGFTPVHLPNMSWKTAATTPPDAFTPPNNSPRTPLGTLSNRSQFSFSAEDGASDTDWDNQSLRCDEDISLSDPEDGALQKVKNIKPKLKRMKHAYNHYKRKGCHRRRLDSEITVDENHPDDQAGDQEKRARCSRRALDLSHIDVAAEKGDDDLWLHTSTGNDCSDADIDLDLGIIGRVVEPLAQPEDFDRYLKMYQAKLGEESALCKVKVEEVPRDIDLVWETLMSDQPDLMNFCTKVDGPYTNVRDATPSHQHASSQTSADRSSPVTQGYSSASDHSECLSEDLRDIDLQPITAVSIGSVRGQLENVLQCAISPDTFDDLISCDLNASDETLTSGDESIATNISPISFEGERCPVNLAGTSTGDEHVALRNQKSDGYLPSATNNVTDNSVQDHSHMWWMSDDTQFVGMDANDMKLVAHMVDPTFLHCMNKEIKQEPVAANTVHA